MVSSVSSGIPVASSTNELILLLLLDGYYALIDFTNVGKVIEDLARLIGGLCYRFEGD